MDEFLGKGASFWMEPLSLMLLTFYLLFVAGGNSKPNYLTTRPPLAERQPGKIHSFPLRGKRSERKLNIETEEKNSTKLDGKIAIETRKSNYTYLNSVKKPQHIFHGQRNSNIAIREKLRHMKRPQGKNDSKPSKHNITTKKQHIFQGKRKSNIDIQGEQTKSPVMYSSQDGQDHYITLRTNKNPHDTQTNWDFNLPSKTFLVTVYGNQIEGAEEKLRNAFTELQPKMCPCKCRGTPCKQTEEACPCEETNDAAQADQQAGGQKLILFPNAGRPFGRSGCICPCCLCSCSEPGHENYNCGCQKSPPVPCPCSSAMNAGIQPLTSSAGSNTSPVYPGTTTGNQVASWTGGTSSCPCSCCPCACAQPQMYPNYQCGCANQSPAPCPCNNQGWNAYQSGAENNAPRSSQNSSPTTPSNSPYTGLVPMSNVAQSPGYSPYTASTPTNNGPVVQTFRSGDYQFENSCDCYCCPCSCPGTEYSTTVSANDNS